MSRVAAPPILVRRPAEIATGAAGSLAVLLGLVFEWDAEIVLALMAVLAYVPAGITFIVELGKKRAPVLPAVPADRAGWDDKGSGI